jgi:hypothetical protein
LEVTVIGYLVPVIILVLISIPIGCASWIFIRTRTSQIPMRKALLRGALLSLLPLAIYVGLFFSLIGLEELTGKALVGEGLARSFLIVVGAGLTVWLLSGISLSLVLVVTKLKDSRH